MIAHDSTCSTWSTLLLVKFIGRVTLGGTRASPWWICLTSGGLRSTKVFQSWYPKCILGSECIPQWWDSHGLSLDYPYTIPRLSPNALNGSYQQLVIFLDGGHRLDEMSPASCAQTPPRKAQNGCSAVWKCRRNCQVPKLRGASA